MRYVSRRSAVDAVRVSESNLPEIEAITSGRAQIVWMAGPGRSLVKGAHIATLDGDLRVRIGEWVVRIDSGATEFVQIMPDALFTVLYQPEDSA